ncbi:hypothetical protein FB548_2040 [Pseudoxanthomonas sp. 3HH-4]|uniref:DUF2092 domain-containing protein n=1 Tax=Pseudoxanthomonas sp. 3HH-4 TaxID=1690214 RepID=UPI001150E57B|nr:DUF2092 domain-containing protein [Pseudoxanthomonas sp. 3HH-4]TQM12115.1 hypothetical protein FB548_2040 [Pseudoxanthomonas sp. 3HH-4]
MKTLKILAATALLVTCISSSEPAASQSGPITPEAEKAMRQIGAALRKLKGYHMETSVTTRAAIGDGKYREFKGAVGYTVASPNQLFAEVRGEGLNRQVYYDGNVITVVAPTQQKYAQVDAPGPSFAVFRKELTQRRGLELPIADLFSWGEKDGPVSAITEGRYAGKGTVAGRSCEHHTFSGAGIIWEVWADERNLPCKVVMVDTRDSGLPGYSAEIDWKSIDAQVQVPRFTRANDMQQVELAELPDSDAP